MLIVHWSLGSVSFANTANETQAVRIRAIDTQRE
jgi:hypothetical protein